MQNHRQPDRPHPHHQPPLNHPPIQCPRCNSTHTKFCYYNNYNLSQPRHFCKTCRRYWTKGGALRNIPVGGAIRKTTTKRPSPSKRRTCTPNKATAQVQVSPVRQSAVSSVDVDVDVDHVDVDVEAELQPLVLLDYCGVGTTTTTTTTTTFSSLLASDGQFLDSL